MEEPTNALLRLKQPFSKCKVSSGDLLCLLSNDKIPVDDLLKLSLHMTITGFSHDSQYIIDIEVSKDMTLNEFKELIMDMDVVQE